MARRLSIPSKQVELRLVGTKDSYFVARLQRLGLNTDFPTTDVDELGNSTRVGITRDTPNVTLTFSVFDVGIKVWSILTGTDYTAYPAIGVDNTALKEEDAVLYIKSDTASTYAKSAEARRLIVRDFSFSYTVDGESTEAYTLIGSEKRWLKYDVVVDKFTVGTTSFTLSQTPIALKNGNNAISVILDGVYLTEVAGAPSTGEYRLVGTTLTTGDSRSSQCLVVYHSNASSAWSDISDTLLPVAVKGRDVDISISANGIDRVQNVTINGNTNPQPVREMGNRVMVGYTYQNPTVDGTITVLDTDVELIDLMTTGSTSSGDTEFLIGEGCTSIPLNLEVTIVDPCDTSAPYTVLKTVVVSGIIITGDAYTSNVNNNATQTFNWKSQTGRVIVYSGAP